ncbi:leucine-rich repeat and coiled-coil domain-containing protein 1 isoform X2 [Nelusetta ayraudi]|uniref:leucine-rich repeat and coiled-coil domain-containing protein 1 isoform X2 n=1 Tax=Nelusetta ayraudi TaxID=303726 RepID=UPI003F6FFC06
MGDKELSLFDKDITSLSDVPLNPTITSLNLHCNHIPRIEGLTSAWHLQHLDLSSNCISQIEGLSSLTSLRTLNLSCNLITKVEGLNGLVNLTRLNLSYNQINNITGLLDLHGPQYKLKHISLQGNQLDGINHLLQCLLGLQDLKGVTLSEYDSDNPVCRLPGYRELVMQALPQISVLDGLDRLGDASYPNLVSPCDIPGLQDYVDLLQSSDTSRNEAVRTDGALTTPRIDEMLTKFRQRTCSEALAPVAQTQTQTQPQPQSSQAVLSVVAETVDSVNEERIKKLEEQVYHLIKKTPADKTTSSSSAVVTQQIFKRDTDHTSESECDSGKENRRRSRIPRHRNSLTKKGPAKEIRSRKSDSDPQCRIETSSEATVRTQKKVNIARGAKAVEPVRKFPQRAIGASVDVTSKPKDEAETYRTILEERDQERERRWKAEQAVRKLTDELKCWQTKAGEEKDLQSLALHTTDRLKELLLRERSGRCELKNRVEELEARCRSLTQQVEQARTSEEQHKAALHRLEENISQGESLRAQQQAEEEKRQRELGNKAAVLRRELDIQRAAVRQQKDKLQKLHELLVSREQEHRKQLDLRLQPDGSDFRQAVAKEVAFMEQKHGQRESELQEKLAEGKKQYAALEDEFRMALTIEAARFSEVKDVCDQMTEELVGHKAAFTQFQEKEKKSASLVQQLTAMVKEQNSRISQLNKAKNDAVTDLKSRFRSLEEELQQDRRASLQLELLKKEKAQLMSQLTAHESVIDGLRAERKIWGQELAHQGVSLAQDRGRLEARIEVLGAELESRKKQSERDGDALKIKAKIVDDQTESIRKLKEALQERDDQLRRMREEATQAQKRFQQQREEDRAQQAEAREQLEHLSLRKEELKQQLVDKDVELEEAKRVHGQAIKKWQEKTDFLTQLESQVKRMKEKFEAKELVLLEERNKATDAQRAAVAKLHNVDDAFRQQLEAVQAAHQAELLQLAKEKQKQIDQAHQKVLQVEDEMRQLLEESRNDKRIMEGKMKRLTSVLNDF